jgi:bacillolysin
MRRTGRIVPIVLALVVGLGVYVAARQAPGRDGRQHVYTVAGQARREWDDRIVAMSRGRELRLRTVQTDTLVPGRRHERLDQYYRGVRVVGGEAVRETDASGTLSLTADLYAGIGLDTTPAVSADDAVRVFMRETGARTAPRSVPELVVLPRDDNSYVLAWRLSAFVDNQLPMVYVDAKTGEVALRYNDLKSQQAAALVGNGILASESLVSSDPKKVSCAQQGSTYLAWDMLRPTTIRTYDLKGNLSRAKDLLDGVVPLVPSDMASNTGTTWTDSVVVDAHTYIGWTYDYFYKRHGWKGLNNADSRPVYIVVHPANRSDFARASADDQGTYYMNAFFCGGCGYNSEDMLMFGEGLPPNYYLTGNGGQTLDYYAAALDVVAHEYTHGVTAYTSNLVYRNESGALNEAFSDIMGTGTEFFQQPAGSGLLKADYLEGEDAVRPRFPGSLAGDRSFVDPTAYGDPDNYSKRYTGTSDNGGVHTNSSIANHAFYLAVEGGTNRTSGKTVTGVGSASRDKVEKVFFGAFTTLTSNATFSQARAKTIQLAGTLYGTGSSVQTAITQAWDAVGVF